MSDKNNMAEIRRECARTLLGMYKKANAGHVGASLSCLEILIEIYFHQIKNPDDMVILSKGHAAAGLYAVLARCGRLDPEELKSFYQDGTNLAAHPPCSGAIPSIPFGTGSLGHGLSLATGLVFSQRFTQKDFKVFCVLSDGECNEGSIWEAALFASHHKLKNLVVIVDANGLQGLGKTEEILRQEPVEEKWKAFGFDTVISSNGNSFESLSGSFEEIRRRDASRPGCVIARTTKGHGVSFMQNKMEWHYLSMNDEQYRIAVSELEEHA